MSSISLLFFLTCFGLSGEVLGVFSSTKKADTQNEAFPLDGTMSLVTEGQESPPCSCGGRGCQGWLCVTSLHPSAG